MAGIGYTHWTRVVGGKIYQGPFTDNSPPLGTKSCARKTKRDYLALAAERDRELLAGGWKILHLRGNSKDTLPDQAVLDAALDVLRSASAQALTLLC